MVDMVVVLHQVPQLGACLLVGCDHGRPRAEAVGAAGCAEQALWGRGPVRPLGHGPAPAIARALDPLCPRRPADRGELVRSCWPSPVLGSKEPETSQGQGRGKPPEPCWLLRQGLPMNVTAFKSHRASRSHHIRTPTVAAEGAGEGEGVGHVISRHLFGHQCHQGTICYLETPETERGQCTRPRSRGARATTGADPAAGTWNSSRGSLGRACELEGQSRKDPGPPLLCLQGRAEAPRWPWG